MRDDVVPPGDRSRGRAGERATPRGCATCACRSCSRRAASRWRPPPEPRPARSRSPTATRHRGRRPAAPPRGQLRGPDARLPGPHRPRRRAPEHVPGGRRGGAPSPPPAPPTGRSAAGEGARPAPARDPVRPQGHLRHPGPRRRRCADSGALPTTAGSRILAGYRSPYASDRGGAAHGSRRGPARQDELRRVRDGLVERELGLRPGAQPLGRDDRCRAARRGGSSTAVAAGAGVLRPRHRHRRLDPPAGQPVAASSA